jgi:hypothetical protein
MATSYIITEGVQDTSYYQFMTRFLELKNQDFYKERIPQKHCKKNI